MILYVNGDSHTAAAEAMNLHAFAEDDSEYFYLGRSPHPDNLRVSWGKQLSLALNAGFHCEAESASSNSRIIRTTTEWLSKYRYNDSLLLIIQWSTWEREEWFHEGVYYQVNASGVDYVPDALKDRYKEYIASIDWNICTQNWHDKIWEFHTKLTNQGIQHIFFNGNNDFSKITNKKDWGTNYIGPYDPKLTFNNLIRARGIQTVAPNSWHFGKDGHSYFHRFMLQYIIDNKLI